MSKVLLRPATIADVSLFGARPGGEGIIGECDGTTAGFALYFHNYSTFLGRRITRVPSESASSRIIRHRFGLPGRRTDRD